VSLYSWSLSENILNHISSNDELNCLLGERGRAIWRHWKEGERCANPLTTEEAEFFKIHFLQYVISLFSLQSLSTTSEKRVSVWPADRRLTLWIVFSLSEPQPNGSPTCHFCQRLSWALQTAHWCLVEAALFDGLATLSFSAGRKLPLATWYKVLIINHLSYWKHTRPLLCLPSQAIC
jgi:hypothetical protein